MPITLLDDSTRPKAPAIHRADPRQNRLALFHAMHLREISHVRAAMERVVLGDGQADMLIDQINSMQMVSNMRQFGNLCGATCQMLTGHHGIEDQWIFPRLMGRSAGLDKVVERLALEHTLIHDMIVAMDAAARRLVQHPSAEHADLLRAEFIQLENFVKSHFGYEQTELEAALDVYEVEI
jgi:hypothetical protein